MWDNKNNEALELFVYCCFDHLLLHQSDFKIATGFI